MPELDALADTFPMLVAGDDAGFMNRVAHLTAPPKPPKKDKPVEQAIAAAPASDLPPPSGGSLADALRAAFSKITSKD